MKSRPTGSHQKIDEVINSVDTLYNAIFDILVTDNDRAKLHQEFLLPMNYPIFRRSNRYLFEDECEKQLINPHESVKPTNNGNE